MQLVDYEMVTNFSTNRHFLGGAQHTYGNLELLSPRLSLATGNRLIIMVSESQNKCRGTS